MSEAYDVAIIGGGPGGTTTASLLKKYRPHSRVVILERERFPREHVGESQLPLVGSVLHEIGVWDAVESAGFPVKVGATYRWGKTDDLWDFEFLAGEEYRSVPRPAPYEGIRRKTAFQVERAVYDEILLRHAEGLGVEVRQECPVERIESAGDEVLGLVTPQGTVQARFYVDASGNAATLRRALGVATEEPSSLRNVAFWDYWNDTEWAVTIGDDATRVNVMSLGYGWIWFIPIAKTRASVGLVVPAETYRKSGKRPAEMYHEAIASEPLIRSLLAGATSEGEVRGTKDWSFIANRMTGSNWYLVGECSGFADPILAAGLTLTHTGARELAHVLAAQLDGSVDGEWINHHYEEITRSRIRQHIRFADYWYTQNTHFTDLKENVAAIAADSGLNLSANEAFQWLGTGGFANDDWRVARLATFALGATKQLTQRFGEGRSDWLVATYNSFRLDAKGATEELIPAFHEGRVLTRRALSLGGSKRLPLVGAYAKWADFLGTTRLAPEVEAFLQVEFPEAAARTNALEVLEAMLVDGWVRGKALPGVPHLEVVTPDESDVLHVNRDDLMARS